MNRNYYVIAAAVLLAALALIGVGYAYQASVTSGSNTIGYDYVTLNDGVSGSTMITYTQDYDTYTNNGTVTYRINTAGATNLIKLNTTPFTLVLEDSRTTSNSYTLTARAILPTLYEDSAGEDWCRFVFVLKDSSDNESIGKNTKGSSDFTFYVDENRVENTVMGEGSTVATLTEGTYTMDVYLVMCSTGNTVGGMECGITVDKDNFVDLFTSASFGITFTVAGA
jgi:hypothetical protein